MRLKRLANENIRLISSEMVRYLLCHEFKGKFLFVIKYGWELM
jgi:hypothetical protein